MYFSPLLVLLAAVAANAKGLRGERQATESMDVKFDLPTRELFRAQFEDASFVFDFNSNIGEEGEGGTISSATAGNYPVVSGENVAMTMLRLNPCGLNLLHHHPRGSELLAVASVGPEGLITGFVEENRGRFVVNTLHAGMVALNPQGLLHFAQNNSCEEAVLFAGFGSDDQGTLTTSTQGIAMASRDTTANALGLTEDDLAALIEHFPSSPTGGLAECRMRCGLDHRK